MKSVIDDETVSFYPNPEIVICKNSINFQDMIFHIAYKIDIYAKEPISRNYIFVDAKNGSILAVNPILKNVNGTAATRYSEPGIWIGYSKNNGENWNYYYTGIVQKQPVYIKPYSQRPLIKEKGVLEIDACLLKQLNNFSHPGTGPEYKCVKDGIYVILYINIIAKDSDGDRLTDIVEDKFFTDKYNNDTNGNGIPDNIDPNPRVNYPRTEKSKIYEAILNDEIVWENSGFSSGKGKVIFKEDPIYILDEKQTTLMITDDKDLMGIKRNKSRVIFMTRKEYQNNSTDYSTLLERRSLTPLFKVDGMKDTYKIGESSGTVSRTFLIRKIDERWIIEIISFAMS